MKVTFSNLLAIASLLTWASAWIATEKNAVAETPSPAPYHASVAVLK